MLDNRLGRIVISQCGRDRDRWFVVVAVVNDQFIMLADGDLRKIENPKMKNIKHVKFTVKRADEVVDHLARGETPGNHVIRKSIKRLQGNGESDGKEVW